MNNGITTYNDLLEEKKRLQELLAVQKQDLQKTVTRVKTEMKPVFTVLNFLKRITSRDKDNLLINAAVDFGTDLITTTGLLKKISWPLRLALPFLMKNLSSNYLVKKKEEVVEKQ